MPYFWNYYFDYNHPLDQFFNISTIKVSYCTLSSIKDHIAKHNTKVYNNSSKTTDERKCDCTCKFKNNCPLKGNCQQKSVVYQAHVTTTKNTMTYTGMTKNSFKSRFLVHNATIEKRPTKEKVTTLSAHVWDLKDRNIPFTIKWSIKTKAYSFSSGSRSCDLCLSEKLAILLADSRFSLNQRDELLAKCPHKKYFCLREYCESSNVT